MTTDRPAERSGTRRSSRAIAVGAGAGLLSGLFGVGGGIIIVPGLMAVMAMDRRLAHGTSLSATVPIAAASLATYAVAGEVDLAVAACLAIGSIGGAVAGTKLLQIVPKRGLVIVFVLTVLATAARLLLADDATGRTDLSLPGAIALVGIGALTGTLAGLLGIGGGVVMVPAMVVLLSMPPAVAKGTSVAVILPTALVGTWRNRIHRNVDVRVGVGVGCAGVVTAVVGGLVSTSISDTLANALFAALLLVVAALQLRTLLEDRT